MLDIQIFRINREIKDQGKVVGSVPLIALGTYTPIPSKTQEKIAAEVQWLGPENERILKKVLVAIGTVDTFATYSQILEDRVHPAVRRAVERQMRLLQLSYPGFVPTRADGQPAKHVDFVAKRESMLQNLQQQVSPEQLIGVMANAVSDYHESVTMYAETRAFLARGIAWTVDKLKHSNLSPELKYLATDAKHRPARVMTECRQRA